MLQCLLERPQMDIILKKEHGLTQHSFFCKLKGKTKKITVVNAGDSPYRKGWMGYAPFESPNGKDWIKVSPGIYDGQKFCFQVSERAKYVCWFPRYNIKRFKELCKTFKKVGKDAFFLGDESKPTIVFIAGQHPAETMGFYFLEGVFNTLISNKKFFKYFSFLIFPCVNEAGVLHKNHRLTPEGIDLNREWVNSNNALLMAIKKQILATKNVCAVIDVHGDEVSEKDYVIYNKDFKGSFLEQICQRQGFLTLKAPSILKKIIKNLVQQKKIVCPFGRTARDYFRKKRILAITLELSVSQNTPKSCIEKGKNYILALLKLGES